jgi:predicted hydrolase (HD superfamily)
MIDRKAAWCLLTEFTQSESLRKHSLAVEACMRACARKFSGGASPHESAGSHHDSTGSYHDRDGSYQGMPSGVLQSGRQDSRALAPEGMTEEDLWGIIGLVHDFDYEKYPSLEDHPYVARRIYRRDARHADGEGSLRL